MGLGNLIPIFYTPIMLVLLGTDEYGLYKLSSSVTSYLSLVSLGIGSAVTRYLIKSNTQEGQTGERHILGLFIVIFQAIAILTLIIGGIIVFSLDTWYGSSLTLIELSRMKILVLLMVLNMALGFSVSPYTSVVTAHEKFIFLQCMNILSTCVAPIVNLIVLFLGYSSIGMACSSLGINVISRFCYVIYVHRVIKLKPIYQKLPFKMIREILIFSFWVFIANISSQLCSANFSCIIWIPPWYKTFGG